MPEGNPGNVVYDLGSGCWAARSQHVAAEAGGVDTFRRYNLAVDRL